MIPGECGQRALEPGLCVPGPGLLTRHNVRGQGELCSRERHLQPWPGPTCFLRYRSAAAPHFPDGAGSCDGHSGILRRENLKSKSWWHEKPGRPSTHPGLTLVFSRASSSQAHPSPAKGGAPEVPERWLPSRRSQMTCPGLLSAPGAHCHFAQ